MDELPGGLRRVTMPLPMRPGHVHCYLLPVDDGYMLVDTGLGLPDAASSGRPSWTSSTGPCRRSSSRTSIPTTWARRRTCASSPGARVVQGRLDAEQAAMTWASDEWAADSPEWFQRNGVPDEVTEELLEQGRLVPPFIRPVLDPELVDDGDELDGWELVAAPGPRRRAADAAPGRRPDRRRPPARCGSRRRSGSGRRAGPTRSGTTSDRCSGRSSSLPRSPTAVTATRSPTRSAGRTS